MTDPGLQTLARVIERESRTRDAAATSLRQAEQRLAQVLAQGEALRQYRRETAARWVMPTQDAATAQQMRTGRDFLDRLDEAIGQHETTMQRARLSAEQLRGELMQTEMRIAVLGKLVDQRRRAESVRQQRADQKASDESARQLLAHAGSRALHGHAEPLGNS